MTNCYELLRTATNCSGRATETIAVAFESFEWRCSIVAIALACAACGWQLYVVRRVTFPSGDSLGLVTLLVLA